MNEPLRHTHTPAGDIHLELEQVQHPDEMQAGPPENPSMLMRLAAMVPYPMPITTNRIVLAVWLSRVLMWHVNTNASTLWSFARRHPWKTVGGIAGAGACGLLCGYFGSLVLVSGIVYVLKSDAKVEKS